MNRPVDPSIRPPIRGIIFDLDGTLVDSRRDIVSGVNRMRMERGLPALPENWVASHIGWGARNLVARCLLPRGSSTPSPLPDPHKPTDLEIDTALSDFRRHYDDCLLETTVPFPGIRELLAEGMHREVVMTVVSNKPERFCRKILAGLGLSDPFAWIAGSDTFAEKKPSPLPLLEMFKRMNVAPAEGVMTGDGSTDFDAARSAGCPIFMVTWGLSSLENIRKLNPDRIAAGADQLAAFLWGPGSI
ncbi:MAG: HAD hydrolase-like protein [Candidatus Eisenbacteria bacterium]|uniref:HAD hydrolase-like protein n=1 Tax=Eiseniibacteriota bacterium TaxID=2212470 RepID=A0A948RW34_UNCEI|nr:HAD hydrolase-like protein [Candidatus Eisenbacteria bacterium]MBU1949572.1 HAD hydrolase-like protein [Candidatus Eisenbacteria bacterium]MBU2692105.1 HAD hydrolase-like protein [Candidatus Eisenbacteria bacterium]